MSKQTVALVGGTGHLGTLIANNLLDQPETELRLLVRAESRGKVAALEKRGARIVEGSLSTQDALKTLCEGVSTVVSAVQGGPDVIVEGQSQLLRAARDGGARRFVPSDYSLDMFKVTPGRIPTSDMRRRFASIADAERGQVEVVHVLNGGFLDRGVLFGFMRMIDIATQTAYVWGEGTQAMDWTTYADTARYTAEVAVDERPVPPVFSIAGDVIDFVGLVHAYELGSGKKLKVERRGSLADLDALIDQRKKAEPANIYAWLPLTYSQAMLNGEAKLERLMNDRYPSIKPTTVREYVALEHL